MLGIFLGKQNKTQTKHLMMMHTIEFFVLRKDLPSQI